MKVKRYLRERQVAELTNIAVSTLRNWRHLGKGPIYVKIGQMVLYPEDGLVNYLALREVKPIDEL